MWNSNLPYGLYLLRQTESWTNRQTCWYLINIKVGYYMYNSYFYSLKDLTNVMWNFLHLKIDFFYCCYLKTTCTYNPSQYYVGINKPSHLIYTENFMTK